MSEISSFKYETTNKNPWLRLPNYEKFQKIVPIKLGCGYCLIWGY
jgi:hypothetical protein